MEARNHQLKANLQQRGLHPSQDLHNRNLQLTKILRAKSNQFWSGITGKNKQNFSSPSESKEVGSRNLARFRDQLMPICSDHKSDDQTIETISATTNSYILFLPPHSNLHDFIHVLEMHNVVYKFNIFRIF